MRKTLRFQFMTLFLISLAFLFQQCSKRTRQFTEIPVEVINDKIHGGLLGQLLGNLNGLPHEFQYIEDPGEVETYIPELPDGARTDDDTDIEWVYIVEMQRSGVFFLPPSKITELWKKYINQNIWCANRYARDLMELGIDPPLTGRIMFNPWSSFNISGQFISECFGLIAPAMPQTAAKLGLHYTHVTIDGEPAQATQLFTSIIASAFIYSDIDTLLAAGLAAIDKKCRIYAIASDVHNFWKENPRDWRITRQKIKERYSLHDGGMRDRNGYELNTAATVASLLYGAGNFTETLRCAFNYGWDADNNAATAGAILGAIHGRKWFAAKRWKIKDVYQNLTRSGMPEDETITGFGNRLTALAEKLILENGGMKITKNNTEMYQIPSEKPSNVEVLPVPLNRSRELTEQIAHNLESGLINSPEGKARAAYLAIAMGEAENLLRKQPIAWGLALESLQKNSTMINNIFNAPEPSGQLLKERATAAGLMPLGE